MNHTTHNVNRLTRLNPANLSIWAKIRTAYRTRTPRATFVAHSSLTIIVVMTMVFGGILDPFKSVSAEVAAQPEEPGPTEEVPEAPKIDRTMRVVMTQYSRADSCHNRRDGVCLMASGKGVYEGAVACPYSLKLGTKILIDEKTYTCEDRYAAWLDKRRGMPTIDVFVEKNPAGRRVVEIGILE